MALLLSPTEARVLGCLIEKEITTPEYYPLTLNSLIMACNQKSNRDPIASYDEEIVRAALESLRNKRLVAERTGGGSRVPKYVHRSTDVLNLGRREIALLCELLVRGPQTPGELRTHAGRMHAFGDLEEVEACLQVLMQFPAQPLVMRLPRQPGTKETRYAHLLSGEVAVPTSPDCGDAPGRAAAPDLEREVLELRQRVEQLEQQFSEFRKAFE